MYIPHHQLQAVHQDVVDNCLRRSQQRRMLKELETQTGTTARTSNSSPTLTALVRSMLNVATRL
jgi:hypothetical protein